MSDLNPTTITITGIDGMENREIRNTIMQALQREGYRVTVRIEHAQRPHYLYGSLEELNEAVDTNPGYSERSTQFEDQSMIALNGHFTVNELDGISFKLRGGQ